MERRDGCAMAPTPACGLTSSSEASRDWRSEVIEVTEVSDRRAWRSRRLCTTPSRIAGASGMHYCRCGDVERMQVPLLVAALAT